MKIIPIFYDEYVVNSAYPSEVPFEFLLSEMLPVLQNPHNPSTFYSSKTDKILPPSNLSVNRSLFLGLLSKSKGF